MSANENPPYIVISMDMVGPDADKELENALNECADKGYAVKALSTCKRPELAAIVIMGRQD